MTATNKSLFERLAENMSDLVALHAPDGRYSWVSPSAERILGYSPEELIGTDPYELFHPDDAESIRNQTHQPAVSGDGNILIRYRIRRADGEYIWFETLTQPIANDKGDVVELHTTSRDVTEQQRIEDALAESEALYRVAMESLEEGVVVHDSEGRIIAQNPQAADILGLNEDELNGREPRDSRWEAIHPDGTPFPAEEHPAMVTMRTGKSCCQVLMGVYSPRWNNRRWISINSKPVPADVRNGACRAAVVVSFSDVTENIEREGQLQRWSTVYRFSGEAIILVDCEGVIRDANKAFSRIVCDEKTAWIGRCVDDITLESRSDGLFASTIWPTLESTGSWRGELWLRDANGGALATWAAMTKVKQSIAAEAQYTMILSDFSERKDTEAKLRHDAGHDSLTGLPNRLLLKDRFEVAMSTAERQNDTFACLYLDLNGFKLINDRYGHSVGDTVLQLVADRISGVMRSTDTVARIGGDEFFVIVFGLDTKSDYQSFAARISEAIGNQLEVDGLNLCIGVSIGVALYPDHGESLETLMSISDCAMYRAKQQRLSIVLADYDA